MSDEVVEFVQRLQALDIPPGLQAAIVQMAANDATFVGDVLKPTPPGPQTKQAAESQKERALATLRAAAERIQKRQPGMDEALSWILATRECPAAYKDYQDSLGFWEHEG